MLLLAVVHPFLGWLASCCLLLSLLVEGDHSKNTTLSKTLPTNQLFFVFFPRVVQTGAFYNWNLTKRKQVISETNGILKDVVIFKYSVHHLGRHVDHYLLSAYMARYRVGWRVETSPVWQLSALFSQTRIDPPNETLFRKKLVDTQTMLL